LRRPKANRLTLIVLSAAFCLFEITMDAGVSFADASPEAERAARVAFEDGRDAYNQGEFAAALVLFERAHALSPKSELLYNIGRAADSDGQNERAIGAYSAYLEAFPQSENREFVISGIDKL
jgi:tetratricopeptide (TPR) repeat protein